jgi:type VI secretion system protein ImpD
MSGLRRAAFPYREQCAGSSDFLWGHAGFALARILLREFAEVGWFAHIRGAPRDTLAGGIVGEVLPVIQVDQCDELMSVLPATDLVISDAMERDLSACGFAALVHCWQTSYCAFFSLPSVYRPARSNDNLRDLNDHIASQLQNILCASRFAHYIKVMMRDKIGSFMSASECQIFLEDWLSQYCIGGENLPWSTQARYPLKAATLTVREKTAEPGHYLCDLRLMPHYQQDGLVGEIQLTTEIAQVKV